MNKSILVVDDEADVRQLVRYNLSAAGYEVREAATGAEAIIACRESLPDVIVLDLMLPDTTGYDICRTLRADDALSEVGILMLTARGEDDDRITGLEAGADDYVVKPFNVREVVLRVSALANRLRERRQRSDQAGEAIRHGELTIDPTTHKVELAGVPLSLRPLEYKLALTLFSDPGRVFSREDLLATVWDIHISASNTRTVDVHIKRLRTSLQGAATWIETVHGFGYRVRPVSES